jgi:hypothetical protein
VCVHCGIQTKATMFNYMQICAEFDVHKTHCQDIRNCVYLYSICKTKYTYSYSCSFLLLPTLHFLGPREEQQHYLCGVS